MTDTENALVGNHIVDKVRRRRMLEQHVSRLNGIEADVRTASRFLSQFQAWTAPNVESFSQKGGYCYPFLLLYHKRKSTLFR